nr:acid phosphatase 1-like [Tanacetum cinerariifolium]
MVHDNSTLNHQHVEPSNVQSSSHPHSIPYSPDKTQQVSTTKIPNAGMKFDSEEELQLYFQEYAYQVGFGVGRTSCEKPGHLKKDCKAGNVGNRANRSSTKGPKDGSSNPLKRQKWMIKGKGTAMDCSLGLFNDIKSRGIQIILISSRKEHLRSATIDNLVDAGFYGWKSLYLRSDEDGFKTVQQYKASVRKELINNGYRLWGILGDQWSSIRGLPTAKRTFKLPNSLYYVA